MTLRFPGQSNIGQVADPFASGIPGPAADGGALACRTDAAALAFMIQRAEQSVQKINLPPQGHSRGMVRAIAIAPDSAIASCDIAIGGRFGEMERHRISPGNPLVGVWPDDDYAFVSIPEPLPQIPGVLDALTEVWWDATIVAPSADTDQSMVGFPLRLELWRGDVVPMRTHRRAPYLAHSVHRITLAQVADTRTLYVCTDGRRRIDVTVSLTGRDNVAGDYVTARAYQVTAVKAGSSNEAIDSVSTEQLALNDAGDLSVAVGPYAAVATSKTFSFSGNPIPILKIVVNATFAETSAGPTTFEIRVRAED